MIRLPMQSALLALFLAPSLAFAQTSTPDKVPEFQPSAPSPTAVPDKAATPFDAHATAPEGTLSCRRADPGSTRPRIGLALGGGGARGIAHVAVIKELERLGVPIDCIAGTSMGSLIGGLYASGMTIDDIEKLVTSLDWAATFNDSLTRPERSFRRKRDDDLSLLSAKPGIGKGGLKLAPGLLSGEKVILLLQRLTSPVARVGEFDRLPVPFRAVATDMNTGEAVVLADGNLAEAMRASMSIPGLFRPMKIGDKILVDGGIANQVPVDVVHAMGADIVIAVDVGTPLLVVDDSASILTYADQLSSFLTVSNTKRTIEALGPRDILVQPDMGDLVRTADFTKSADALRIGNEAMATLGPKLAPLARPAVAKDSEQNSASPVRTRTLPRIDFVRLDNRSQYADAVLLHKLDIRLGQTLDIDQVETGIERVYGLNTLDTITYDIVEENGRTGLVVHVKPQTYGPDYLETGLSVFSDFRGDFLVNLRLGVLRTPINANGGELRLLGQIGSEPGLSAELYQPLGISSRYFVGAKASYETPQLNIFTDNGLREAEYELPSGGVEAYAGREFGNYGALTVNVRRRHGSANRLVGSPELPEIDYDQGEIGWTLAFDRLDSFQIPRDGTYAAFGQVLSRKALGADENFVQLNVDVISARAIGAHSAYFGVRYHDTTSGIAPLPSLFRLGGVTRLPGYRPNERFTPNYALAFVGYTYELGRVLNRPSILGGTLEYARLWGESDLIGPREREAHASVYYGFDSWLGRFLFGYGLRQGGEGTFFIELGRNR
jgi:NTE family protein